MFSRHETEESVPKRVVISELVQYEALAKKINGPLHNIFATVRPNEHDPGLEDRRHQSAVQRHKITSTLFTLS